MVEQTLPQIGRTRVPAPRAVLELLKPITWFPPMWAYACGFVSGNTDFTGRWPYVLAGILLAGPLVCGASQAVNDWYDRHVDAINEPHRVIPSGRMPGRWGLYVAIVTSGLSLLVAALLGMWIFAATVVGVALAWAYSAPPFRLKMNGWWGNLAVGLCYETLPWITAAVAATGLAPSPQVLSVALLYGLGAHGIMTLNDFKAIEGDTRLGVRTLPVRLGVDGAARTACATMTLAQLAVALLLVRWGAGWHALAVFTLIAVQLACMTRFLRDPRRFAIWYSALGVGLYVTGMMIAAVALRGLAASQGGTGL